MRVKIPAKVFLSLEELGVYRETVVAGGSAVQVDKICIFCSFFLMSLFFASVFFVVVMYTMNTCIHCIQCIHAAQVDIICCCYCLY